VSDGGWKLITICGKSNCTKRTVFCLGVREKLRTGILAYKRAVLMDTKEEKALNPCYTLVRLSQSVNSDPKRKYLQG
jgi:hypothetical protein